MRFFYLLIIFSLLAPATWQCKKTQPCIDIDKIDPTLVCDNSYNPVCGCDNITYQNSCHAQRSGVVAWIGGPCL